MTSVAAINKAQLLVVPVGVGTAPQGSANTQVLELMCTWDVWDKAAAGPIKVLPVFTPDWRPLPRLTQGGWQGALPEPRVTQV